MRVRTIDLVRLYADQTGESHFDDERLETAAAEFAPPAPPVAVSAPTEARRSLFLLLPEGWHGDLHPAPGRQLMVLLSGELEVTASDGEARRFRAGDAVLVEDTFGRGHATSSVDGEAVLAVVQR
jgi:Cupin domain